MGALHSRRNAGVEELDVPSTNAYRYPPKSGCYFGNYFMMGGERFDTTQPEAYLFGENQDLNFLGCRPVPFPYPAPQANEPTKTLKSLVNIRKDSIHFVKIEDEEGEKDDESSNNTKYNIEFTFDTDVRVAITVYYFATEEIQPSHISYRPRDSTMNSETYHYKRGANQTFSQSTHIIDPSKFPEEDWQYNPDKEIFPVVIHCVVEDDQHNGLNHSHSSFAYVEKGVDGHYMLKPLKQKQMVDGLCYLLQEIYGIENKIHNRTRVIDEELDDNSLECVICMSDVRDTLILPCRHLCLCNGCADSLRYQANNCPICRAPFRALLQIRAMRKKQPLLNTPPQSDSDETLVSQEGVPPGYEAVSLIEALNGPMSSHNNHPLHFTDNNTRSVSLPTSPEESPFMSKRKAPKSRQPSFGPAGQVDTVQEEISLPPTETTALTPTDREQVDDGVVDDDNNKNTTRKNSERQESVKSKKERGSSKRRSSKRERKEEQKNTETVVEPSSPIEGAVAQSPQSEEYVEILDEVSNKESHDADGGKDLEAVQPVLHTVLKESHHKFPVPPPPLSKSLSHVKGHRVTSSPIDLDEDDGESAILEASLPGTPVITDDSSYSSTCSTSRLLLLQNSSNITTPTTTTDLDKTIEK